MIGALFVTIPAISNGAGFVSFGLIVAGGIGLGAGAVGGLVASLQGRRPAVKSLIAAGITFAFALAVLSMPGFNNGIVVAAASAVGTGLAASRGAIGPAR
ncbi:MAG TPA: hypothetical protein VK139_05730 [Microbacteriaceae bacterium]|nr:hypothetical protein [Microbacteriaceae bacterium]